MISQCGATLYLGGTGAVHLCADRVSGLALGLDSGLGPGMEL